MSTALDRPVRFDDERDVADASGLAPQHLDAIGELAEQEKCPVEEVQRLYAITLYVLKEGARIQDYLILLTCKKVRSEIRRSRKNALQPVAMNPVWTLVDVGGGSRPGADAGAPS